MKRSKTNTYLELSDGSRFYGDSFGSECSVAGEVVFNTGMVGYPQSLTDPSYRGQILTMTYPLIGNYGIGSRQDFESGNIKVSGLIIDDYSKEYSHWSATKSLADWLKENNVPGLYGIDTRALTKKLREKGVMLGKIVIDKDIALVDPNERDLVSEVTTGSIKVYQSDKKSAPKILLIDTGCKENIIKSLQKRGAAVIRIPYDYDFLNDSEIEYDGILLSNGPGDPKMCKDTINNIRQAINQKNPKPIMGICLGNQILALAAGADTYKLKYGHRSQNQPCIMLENGKPTKRCYITSQNHGYAVNTKTLNKDWEPWFINANDGTNEGIRHKTKPFFSNQGHPEATPGPTDIEFLFDYFLEEVEKWKK